MRNNFTFIHAADIHLDSPLHGLSRKDEERGERQRRGRCPANRN
jgi:DNA repair exonuclease SbcCD nuclease subunit